MLINIAIASFLMVLTTVIHTGGMLLAMHIAQMKYQWQHLHVFRIGFIILLMFFASLLEVLVWAVTFVLLNAIEKIDQALYFSMVTFTTLGYGDVVLDERWRLLGSFEAANGIILFGWTTAIVLYAVQHAYYGKKT